MRHLPLALFLGLVACEDKDDNDDDDTSGGGGSPDRYMNDYVEAYCAQIFACYDAKTLSALGLESEDQCVELYTAQWTGGTDTGGECDFHAEKAEECVNDLASASCDEFLSGAWAAACMEVCG